MPGSVPVVWGAVLVMALAAMLDPLRIGVTVLVISRPRPVLQLLAFWLGGLVMGLAVGLGALFLLRDLTLTLLADMPAGAGNSVVALVQVGLGTLAFVIAKLMAFVAGAALATPLQYVAALAAILVSDADAATQVAALVAYHAVVLAFAEIPLLGSVVAPEPTYAVMLRLHDWMVVRRRHLAAVIVAAIGAFLFINGMSGI